MTFSEKTITSGKKFEGKVFSVRVETVKLPQNAVGYREIVDHPGGVGIVAITDSNKILLVKQFRKAVEKELIEIPAGKLEKGEAPAECGKRELTEETGYTAGEFISLGAFYPSPGFANEVTYLYLARRLSKGEKNPDEDEFLDVFEFTSDEIYSKIIAGEITDAKTIIGFFKTMEFIKNN